MTIHYYVVENLFEMVFYKNGSRKGEKAIRKNIKKGFQVLLPKSQKRGKNTILLLKL
jgi:hypothetical protein